jgi:phospholipase C
MPEGNGDTSLCIFGENVTPNHHALAREFVLLDNFYVDAEVSADGHNWSMAGYATDYVEKTCPSVMVVVAVRMIMKAAERLLSPKMDSFGITARGQE